MCNTWLRCDVCPSLNIQYVTYCNSTTWKCAVRNPWLWCDVCPSLYIQYVTYCNSTLWQCAIRAFAPLSTSNTWRIVILPCDNVQYVRLPLSLHRKQHVTCECVTSHVDVTHVLRVCHINVLWHQSIMNVSHHTLMRHTCECVTSHVTYCDVIKFSDFERVTSHVTYCNFNALTCDVLYRVAKTHRMPYLYRSFSATEPYNKWLFYGKWRAT